MKRDFKEFKKEAARRGLTLTQVGFTSGKLRWRLTVKGTPSGGSRAFSCKNCEAWMHSSSINSRNTYGPCECPRAEDAPDALSYKQLEEELFGSVAA